MKRKILFAIISILFVISVFINFFIFFKFKGHKKQISEVYLQNYNKYLDIVGSINSSFALSGYTEILKDKNFFLSMPLNSKENDLFSRQKLFIYKNTEKNCIIELVITANKNNLNNNEEWTSSYDYAPIPFNNKEGQYSSTYSAYFPQIQIASNSFNYYGCHLSILSFSNDTYKDNKVRYLAAEELMNFSNSLLDFFNEKGYLK